MGGIFISYRREDSGPYAGRLRDTLSRHFGAEQVYRDIDRINPGERFPRVIDHELGSCAALLAVIGPTWLAVSDAAGRRRLDDPDDLVRREISTVLGRSDALVVPVLVGPTSMPAAAELPEPLAALSECNAVRITDESWDDQMARLTRALEGVVTPRVVAPPTLRELGFDGEPDKILNFRRTSERPIIPLRKLSNAVSSLLGIHAAIALILGIANLAWPASESPVERTFADISRNILGVAITVIMPCTIVLFLVYLYYARVNAEALTPFAKHRHGRMMVVFAWFIPVVQFWWPKQILDDVWRASGPDTPRDITDLSALPRPGLVRAWWFGFATFWGVLWALFAMSAAEPGLAKSSHPWTPFLDAVFLLDIFIISSLSAIPAILLVRRITLMQEARLAIIGRMQR